VKTFNKINMSNIKNFKEANYKYVKYEGNGSHILEDVEAGVYERWVSRTYPHAGFSLKYKKTHLEFVASVGKKYEIEKPEGTFYSDYSIQDGKVFAIFEHGMSKTTKFVCNTIKTNKDWMKGVMVMENEKQLVIVI
jgi:hypothetical protein